MLVSNFNLLFKWRQETIKTGRNLKSQMSKNQKIYSMKNKLFTIGITVATILGFSNCSTINKSMREPNVKLNLNKSDFTLSDQFEAEATSLKIVGIDWERLFMKKTGEIGGSSDKISLATLPVIGSLLTDKTSNYALYNLMSKNPGYDVVFYPQYETKIVKPFLGIGFITKITKVKTIARLGKLNK
jgi:hypothetical protein